VLGVSPVAEAKPAVVPLRLKPAPPPAGTTVRENDTCPTESQEIPAVDSPVTIDDKLETDNVGAVGVGAVGVGAGAVGVGAGAVGVGAGAVGVGAGAVGVGAVGVGAVGVGAVGVGAVGVGATFSYMSPDKDQVFVSSLINVAFEN
jgi:hypothetical protein